MTRIFTKQAASELARSYAEAVRLDERCEGLERAASRWKIACVYLGFGVAAGVIGMLWGLAVDGPLFFRATEIAGPSAAALAICYICSKDAGRDVPGLRHEIRAIRERCEVLFGARMPERCQAPWSIRPQQWWDAFEYRHPVPDPPPPATREDGIFEVEDLDAVTKP